MAEVDPQQADIAWMIYDLEHNSEQNRYRLTHVQTIYTRFKPALDRLTTADPGPLENFIRRLQAKLDERLNENPPDAPILTDFPLT